MTIQPVKNYFLEQEFKEVRCPSCKKLLFTICGFGCIIRIPCKRCGSMVEWPNIEAMKVNDENTHTA